MRLPMSCAGQRPPRACARRPGAGPDPPGRATGGWGEKLGLGQQLLTHARLSRPKFVGPENLGPRNSRTFASVRDVGDVVEKFTGDPGVPGVTSRSGTSSSEWGPPLHRPDFRGGPGRLGAVEAEPLPMVRVRQGLRADQRASSGPRHERRRGRSPPPGGG